MKLELRAITVRPAIFDKSVMMSSLMPSEKYSCSGSPDMLVNGKTAIDAATFGSGLAAWIGRRWGSSRWDAISRPGSAGRYS